MITIENQQLGDLVVTNVERYFDESGSYLDHYQAQANRAPTTAEMNKLFDQKIVCISSVNVDPSPSPFNAMLDAAYRGQPSLGDDSDTLGLIAWFFGFVIVAGVFLLIGVFVMSAMGML